MKWFKADFTLPDVGPEISSHAVPSKIDCEGCVHQDRISNWKPVIAYIGNFPNGKCMFGDKAFPIQMSKTSTREFAIAYGETFFLSHF